MPIFSSVQLTLKVAQDVLLTQLLLHRDRETITDTFEESVSGTTDIAVSTTFTVPMTHLTTGQFLYVETTNPISLHFDAGTDDIRIAPPAVGTNVRYIMEGGSFTSLTIENESASVIASSVFFMVLGT